eukprot:scaffold38031_cov68-Phaeocystis_antarctica.AAC.2
MCATWQCVSLPSCWPITMFGPNPLNSVTVPPVPMRTLTHYTPHHWLIILLTYELRLETKASMPSPSLSDQLSIHAKSSSRVISENGYLVIHAPGWLKPRRASATIAFGSHCGCPVSDRSPFRYPRPLSQSDLGYK